MKNMKNKGFTIVELVIVIAIVAVLAAVLIPSFASLIQKANDSAYLQDRTNQQISDLAEKVENQEFLTWEDFEAELAKQIASIQIPEGASTDDVEKATEATKTAIVNAVTQFEQAVKNNNTSLTEAQVKTIIEKALENSLTTAQVQGIVDSAIAKINIPTGLTNKDVEDIVNKAISKIEIEVPTVKPGATTEEVNAAINAANNSITAAIADVLKEIEKIDIIQPSVGGEVDMNAITATINDAVAAALAGIEFNPTINPEVTVETLTAEQIKEIVDASIKNLNVLTEADVAEIVNGAVDGAVETLKANVGTTGITTEQMNAAIQDALSKVQVNVIGGTGASVNYAIIQSYIEAAKNEVTAAINNFNALNEDAIKDIINAAVKGTVNEAGFASGNGTAENPYIIKNAEQLLSISDNYDTYNYYKIADGVTAIDCSGWPTDMKLNGSFDGNGATLVNLSAALFNVVGDINVDSNIVIENFTAHMENTAGRALVRNIYNGGTTTFRNIELYGTVEGEYNIGSFYNYGTCNAPGSDGKNYTVNFVNAKSYLTLICTTGNTIGGMIGHTYQGTGFVVTVNMDSKSGYFGKMYSTGTTGKTVMAIAANTCNLIGATNDAYPVTKLLTVAPVENAGVYTVAKQEGVSSYTVSVLAQVSSYDKNGNQIANASGITLVVSREVMYPTADGVVFNCTDAVIVNEYLNGELGYKVENGVLKVYVGDRDAYSGNINLQVTQYDENGNIIATGLKLIKNIEYNK